MLFRYICTLWQTLSGPSVKHTHPCMLFRSFFQFNPYLTPQLLHFTPRTLHLKLSYTILLPGVIISTILIQRYGWTWTDAFMSILIAVLIFVRSVEQHAHRASLCNGVRSFLYRHVRATLPDPTVANAPQCHPFGQGNCSCAAAMYAFRALRRQQETQREGNAYWSMTKPYLLCYDTRDTPNITYHTSHDALHRFPACEVLRAS